MEPPPRQALCCTMSRPLLADSPLRQALDCSDNAIALTNRDRQVVYVNQGFTRLLASPVTKRGAVTSATCCRARTRTKA